MCHWPQRQTRRKFIASSKTNRGGLRRAYFYQIPSTSTASSTSPHKDTAKLNRAANSTQVHSTVACPAKRHKGNSFCGWRAVRKKASSRKNRRRYSLSSAPSPQPQCPQVHNQTGQNQGTPVQSVGEQDISSCDRFYYKAHIGNETRTIEFKQGGERYILGKFGRDVCIYGCAFLNSGGGSLLVGVRDDGVVCGVKVCHKLEDEIRQQMDSSVKLFQPPLLPHNYTMHFLPVIKCGKELHQIKVLRLTFKPPPAFPEPVLYQTGSREVYLRRDGSVEGPLSVSVILQWSREMWSGKVQQLNDCVHEARSEWWFLAGQFQELLKSIGPMHQLFASLLAKKRKRKKKQVEIESEIKTNSRHSPTSSYGKCRC